MRFAFGTKRTEELSPVGSAFDPNVWTGRVLQEAFGDGEGWSCANVSGLCVEPRLRAMMDIRALPISLADRP